MSKPSRRALVALAALSAYAWLNALPLDRPGPYEDEGFLSLIAARWLRSGISWADAAMASPYTGSLKTWALWALFHFRPPDVAAVRLVSLASGAAVLAALVALTAAAAGPGAAAVAAALLLSDPGFFVYARQDFTGGPLAMAFALVGALLLLGWWRGRPTREGAAGAALLGAAVWSYLPMAVPLACMAAAALVCERARAERRLCGRRSAAVLAAALAAGALPFALWLAWPEHRARFLSQVGDMGNRNPWPTVMALRLRVLTGTLSGRLAAAFLLPDGAGRWLAPGWLLAPALAGGAAAGLSSRAARACWAGLAACCAVILTLRGVWGFHHGVLALCPWLPLALALSCAANGRARAIAAAAAVAIFASHLRTTLELRGAIAADAVRPQLQAKTAAELASLLAGRREKVSSLALLWQDSDQGTPVYSGFLRNLRLIAPDCPDCDDRPIGARLADLSSGAARAPLEDRLWILMPAQLRPGSETKMGRRFLEAAAALGLKPVMTAGAGRDGDEPVAALYRLEPR